MARNLCPVFFFSFDMCKTSNLYLQKFRISWTDFNIQKYRYFSLKIVAMMHGEKVTEFSKRREMVRKFPGKFPENSKIRNANQSTEN